MLTWAPPPPTHFHPHSYRLLQAEQCNFNRHDEMNLFSIFLPLVTPIVSVENVKFRVLIYRDTEKCAAAASAKMATLQIRRMVIAYFNKKTRQVHMKLKAIKKVRANGVLVV
nr:unnamed protein product [Haemonchus contortus]